MYSLAFCIALVAASRVLITGITTSILDWRFESAGVAALLVRGVEYPETDSESFEVVTEDTDCLLAAAAATDALLGRPRGRLTGMAGSTAMGAASLDADDVSASDGVSDEIR